MISGTVDARFALVKDAFADNVTRRGEQGAALCVRIDGRTVVDLWAGAGWRPDSLVNVFSVGKGLIAIVLARLVGRGLIEPPAPVARYWPEFAAADKDATTVAQLFSHQAGLPALRRPLPPGAMFDHDFMARALATEQPWWEPGTGHGYHVNTYGFLAGELVRRATGTTLGAIVRDEIGGGDIFIGVPASQSHRVIDFHWPGTASAPEVAVEPDMTYNTYFNPPGISGDGTVNTAAWRSAELPSANTHASARGIAAVYDALLAGRLATAHALAAVTAEQVNGNDLVLGRPSRFGLGFQLPQPDRPLGPNPEAFGHFGAGGSLGFADPASGVGFGYVMNTMGGTGWQSSRNRALIDALYTSLDGPA
ncbi:serine hydrolase domain-containing protein [Nonomuraea rosea]|uniref:Serine hydrolase domain-containing protein n=1 Tax=Nonomuraea rosea TaxID=638574 RepID=A0ABP7A0C4_9ACTN